MTDGNILPFVDIETTGLNPRRELILEVGIDLRDADSLEPIAYIDFPIHYGPSVINAARDDAPPIVKEMHKDNGLWQECYTAPYNITKVEEALCDFMQEYSATGLPMAGSSLRLDREFLENYMPRLHKLFHYRSIDNSSTKELCRIYAPNLYSTLPDSDTDHRVRTCLTGTIEEFGFYKAHFLKEDIR